MIGLEAAGLFVVVLFLLHHSTYPHSSDEPWLKEPLDNYLKLLPKIKLVRLKERSGLMRARTAGAEAATGEVVVFLDSHIEVTMVGGG